MYENKYRLVTRSDMDGLVCGTLLKYLGIIDEITFVHPKDMQDCKSKLSKNINSFQALASILISVMATYTKKQVRG